MSGKFRFFAKAILDPDIFEKSLILFTDLNFSRFLPGPVMTGI